MEESKHHVELLGCGHCQLTDAVIFLFTKTSKSSSSQYSTTCKEYDLYASLIYINDQTYSPVY